MRLGLSLLVLASASAFGQSSDLPHQSTAKTITRGASVTIKIDKFEDLRAALVRESEKLGGVLADAKVNVSPKGRKYGWFRISVPAKYFEEAMSAARKQGTLVGEQSSTRNRDPELKELDIRRASVGAHVERLTKLSQSTKRMRASDQLYYQDLIFRAEADRDLLLHEKHKIESNVENASIIVTAFEKGQDVTTPPSGWDKFAGTVSRSAKDFALGTAGSVVDWTVSALKIGVAFLIAIPIRRKFGPRLKQGWRRFFGQESLNSSL